MSLDVEPALVIRADGGPSVGGGHIMRSLALAQEWRLRGGTVDYLIPPEAKGFEERLLDEGIRVHCIDPAGDENGGVTADVARECGASWVILDGYRFSPSFHATLRECSPELGILSVDDNRDYRDYSSNIVLNTNPYASEELYKGVESKLLLGSRFALLRSEFRLLAGRPAPVSGPVTTVVVSMGASDPDNATTDVLAALNGTGFDGELRVILGPGYRHAEPTLPRGGTLLRSVADMSAEFRRADLVIGGSGSTCWELCYLGRAMVAVVLAENQRRVGESLQSALAAEVAFASEDIGSAIERALSAGAAERLATAAASLIDGMGASRVVAEMQGAPFWLRRVASTDAERLFAWSNDPVTRSMSFRPDPIGWEEHVEWFTRKLADPTSIMFIALNDDAEVGVVRFDQRETRETISVSVAPDARGRGHAVRLIRLGCRALRSVGRQGAVDAWIQTRNVASIKSFERAGFSKVEDGEQGGAPAVRFEWRQ